MFGLFKKKKAIQHDICQKKKRPTELRADDSIRIENVNTVLFIMQGADNETVENLAAKLEKFGLAEFSEPFYHPLLSSPRNDRKCVLVEFERPVTATIPDVDKSILVAEARLDYSRLPESGGYSSERLRDIMNANKSDHDKIRKDLIADKEFLLSLSEEEFRALQIKLTE